MLACVPFTMIPSMPARMIQKTCYCLDALLLVFSGNGLRSHLEYPRMRMRGHHSLKGMSFVRHSTNLG